MGRRGYSTTIGKFAKTTRDRRRSEIRRLGVLLRVEQDAAGHPHGTKPEPDPPALPQAD